LRSSAQTRLSTAEDNIVRVEMRMLRKRLDEYFQSEGKEEPFAIVVPKGSTAVFEVREPRLPVELPAASSLADWWRLATRAISALASVCGSAGPPEARGATLGAERVRMWPLLFDGTADARSLCDSTLVIAEGVVGHSISLDHIFSRLSEAVAERYSRHSWLLPTLPFWNFTDLATRGLSSGFRG